MSKLPTLSALGIIVTYACNSKCSYCFIKQNNDTITKDNILKAHDFYKEYVNRPEVVIQIWGGEPLLKIELCEYIAELFPKNRLFISTNGLVFNERVKTFLEKNKDRLDLQISCDGKPTGQRTNELLTIENAEKISKILPIIVRSTITPQRIETIYDDTLFIVNNFDTKQINHKIQHEINEFNTSQLKKFDEQLEKLRRWYELDFSDLLLPIFFYYWTLHKTNNFYCPAALGEIMVDPHGDIYPCLTMANMKINKLSSVDNTDSLINNINKLTRINCLEDKHSLCALTQNTCLIHKMQGEKEPSKKAEIVTKIIMKHSSLLHNYLRSHDNKKFQEIQRVVC